ncbi:MAG TPA: copper amine oxidase N-terminal domain-containing protein, partial [Candidatus Acidoferrales bacterium]|nr:copper amine oxidase N-terminal domain-containing protein [Candidatus Acidoferrales bacterium]
MKRLSTGVLAALLTAGFGLNAVAAPTSASQGNIGNAIAQAGSSTTAAPPANFGSPPSGQIPILFNDHHVYTKPDKLKQGRVLAALVRGGTILIPLRSMFEQMGATVSYDASSKTVDVSKPGADVKVTVGKPEVVINGETRPLDVPPEIYKGHVVVPVRVISEGMGAYVQWVPDRQLVVVRYIPPTPPPPPSTPAPTEAPTVAPTPTPAPKATPYEDLFVAGDY